MSIQFKKFEAAVSLANPVLITILSCISIGGLLVEFSPPARADGNCTGGICEQTDTDPIVIAELPSTLAVNSTVTLTGLVGYYAKVAIAKVTFGSPDPGRVPPLYKSNNFKTCSDLARVAAPAAEPRDKDGKIFEHAMLTLQDWHDFDFKYNLMINANWFDVRDPFASPHINKCTNIFGLAIADGALTSSMDDTDRDTHFDALLINGALEIPYEDWSGQGSRLRPYDARIVNYSHLHSDNPATSYVSESKTFVSDLYNNPRIAVSGIRILTEGGPVPNNRQGAPNSPEVRFARSAVGLSEDGKTMIFVVEQRGKFEDAMTRTSGLTGNEMGLLMKHLGAHNALNLDNSGSAQLVYYANANDARPTFQTRPGDSVADCHAALKIPCTPQEVATEDRGDHIRRQRPIPNFLGVINPPSTRKRTTQTTLVAQNFAVPTRQIASQTWTVADVRTNSASSLCFDKSPVCPGEARFYTADAAAEACRQLGANWRLPTDEEWQQLARDSGGYYGPDNDGKAGFEALKQGGRQGFNAEYAGKILAYDDRTGASYPSVSSYDQSAISYYVTASKDSSRTRNIVYTIRSTDGVLLREAYDSRNYFSARCILDQ